MSQFITLKQVEEFWSNKVREDEVEPKLAQAKMSIIQELLKKYISKQIIDGGKEALAPTEEQWKKISDYHKGKILYYQTHPNLAPLGKKNNNAKIREHENKSALAKKMCRWAQEMKKSKNLSSELRDLSSILVIKPTDKKVTFPERIHRDSTEGVYPVLKDKEKHRYNTRSQTEHHRDASGSDSEEGEKSKERPSITPEGRRELTTHMRKRNKSQNLEDVPLLQGTLYYPSSTQDLISFNDDSRLTKNPPPYHPTPSTVISSKGTTPTQMTHKVMGGALSLTPVGPPSNTERRLQDIQNQVTALTSIVETSRKFGGTDCLRSQGLTTEERGDVARETRRHMQVKEPFEVTGSFTGIIDADEFNEAYINGTVDPMYGEEQKTNHSASIYPLRTNENQQMIYQPFSLKDWSSLMLTLPKLTKGGVPWMRALMKQTAGDKLCWGDIHAALTKAADETVAERIEAAVGRKIRIPLRKTAAIQMFREALEEELKTRYPCTLTDELMSLQMKNDEDYHSYKQRAKTLYHDATGEPIQTGTGMTVMFYSALVKGMPKPIQDALSEVMGLYTKTEEDFDVHCNHHVTKWINNNKETDSKKQELELATMKLQLHKLQEEVKDKKKEKPSRLMTVQQDFADGDAPVTTNQLLTAIKTVMQPQQQPPQTFSPTAIYARSFSKFRGRGRGYNGPRPRFIKDKGFGACFTCGGRGHWSKECATQPQGQPQGFDPQQRFIQSTNQPPMMQPMMHPQMAAPRLPPSGPRVMNIGSNYHDGRDVQCFDGYNEY
ncbi:unnamed protein product [Knipowitschia caucasica]